MKSDATKQVNQVSSLKASALTVFLFLLFFICPGFLDDSLSAGEIIPILPEKIRHFSGPITGPFADAPWQAIGLLDPEHLKKTDTLWLEIKIPPLKLDRPIFYIHGFLTRLIVRTEKEKIYEFNAKTDDALLFHQIPIGSPERTGEEENVVYLQIPYDRMIDIGGIHEIGVGTEGDVHRRAARSLLDAYRGDALLICLSGVLIFTGLMSMIVFIQRRRRSIDYPFLSFGFFSLMAGLNYLNLETIAVAYNLSFSTWNYFETFTAFLLPVGFLFFIAETFPSPLNRGLKFLAAGHFGLMMAAAIMLYYEIYLSWFSVFQSAVVLISIGFVIVAIIRSRFFRTGAVKSALATIGALLIFLSLAAIDVLNGLELVPFGGQFYGYGILVLVCAFICVLVERFTHATGKARDYALQLETRKREVAQLEQARLLARFEALKSQINPHFLFNTLGTLMALIEQNPVVAVEYVQELASVYRYVLQIREKKLIPLSDELTFIYSYLFLISKRFGESIHVDMPAADNYRDVYVPPLSLQLLIENAVKHNIISKKKPLYISIILESGYLAVKNTLQKKRVFETSTGLGLSNLKERYRFLTEKNVILDVDSTSFVVKIPLLDGDSE